MSACNPYNCERHFYVDSLNPTNTQIVVTKASEVEGRIFLDLECIEAMWLVWEASAKPKNWKIYLKGRAEAIEFALGTGQLVFEALQRYKGKV